MHNAPFFIGSSIYTTSLNSVLLQVETFSKHLYIMNIPVLIK